MILPDGVFVQLQHLLDLEAVNQWAVGDFIVDVWAEIQRYAPEEEQKQEHADMIKQMASNTGADKSTLRHREKMSGFYPVSERGRWMPPYSYHHLRALMSADNFEETAHWGLTGSIGGGVATVAEIRHKIKGDKSPEQLEQERIRALYGKIQAILGDSTTSPTTRMGVTLIKFLVEALLTD
jgi:hypothetical protein